MSEIVKQWNVPISKVDEDRRQVFGWASVTSVNGIPVVDHQGDVIDDNDLEDSVYKFVLDTGLGNDQHTEKVTMRLIESMMFTKEKQQALGIDLGKTGWWAGWQIDDEDSWQRSKLKLRRQFSIEGTGYREEIASP